MTVAATLLVRADADGRRGIGHVMRCLALAGAWQAAGGRVVFASHCPVAKLRRRIRAAGPEVISLEHPHPHPSDLAATLNVLAGAASPSENPKGHTWVALDGYHFDSAYQRAVRDTGARLLAVDDQAHLDRYHADVLLNQNLHAEELDYPCAPETVLLYGCRYGLLRQEFLNQGLSLRRRIPSVARKLLVTLGGADPENATPMVIAALERLNLPGLEAKVLVGPANPQLQSLQDQARRRSSTSSAGTSSAEDVQILSDVSDVPGLMAWADLAVSAAGSTCWEMAWMQLPAAVIVTAPNQEPIARRLSQAGVVTSLGHAAELDAETIAEALAALCHDRQHRADQIAAGRRLVDGRGARRVVAVMHALDGPLPDDRLELRPVAAQDLLPLWRLANDPANRQASVASSDPIPLEEHTQWFKQRLSSAATRIWVLDLHGVIAAVVRYDRTDADAAEISLGVFPAFRKRGLGTRLLDSTCQVAFRELGVECLRAIIRQENVASMRTFAKAGFRKVDSRLVHSRPCHVCELTSPGKPCGVPPRPASPGIDETP